MFPDTFWLKAGIAQALPAFLHLRGLLFKKRIAGSAVARSALAKERIARSATHRTTTCGLPCCPRPVHLLPGDENPGMSRADNGAC
ncbi:hypothetical protein KW836_05455 [Achromobacter sp. ACM05]|nr:hypothetical protein [Achromobacter sp. ACM05]